MSTAKLRNKQNLAHELQGPCHVPRTRERDALVPKAAEREDQIFSCHFVDDIVLVAAGDVFSANFFDLFFYLALVLPFGNV